MGRIKRCDTPLTQDRLRAVLVYDPEHGTWIRIAHKYSKGLKRDYRNPGYRDPRGRLLISVDGREYLSHRLAFFYMTGAWPLLGLDHKDGDCRNDRWTNLRPANQSENEANARKRSTAKSALKGASFDASRGRWVAQITKNYRNKHLGRYDTEEEAHAAYVRAAHVIHGEFARAK